MIEIVAWIGAITGLLAGIIMLVQPVTPEKRSRTRLMGVVLLGVAALNFVLATRVL